MVGLDELDVSGRIDMQKESPVVRMYPWLTLCLIIAGPYFFFQMVWFLRTLDYTGALFSLLAGWFLLRGGLDLARIVLLSKQQQTKVPTKSSTPRSSHHHNTHHD